MTHDHVMRPGSIGSLAVPNRIVMGSMHLGLETARDDGQALAAFYTERVRGGVGLIITGGWAVSGSGAAGPSYGVIGERRSSVKLARVVDAVHRAGGRIVLQLFHAGRYARRQTLGLPPLAPSAVASRLTGTEPVAMSDERIRSTIADFASAAAHAAELGFDGVEVMASEGYLINQFLSPLTNRRADAWGGDSRRRMRFPAEVLRAIRAAVQPDFPVLFRISGDDLMAGSSTADEVRAFARLLADGGVDALNIGIGWHESPVPTVQPQVPAGMWVPWAESVKEAVGDLPVIASNRITSMALADNVLASTNLDFVSLARPLLADPDLIVKSVTGRPVNTCLACNQACIDRSLFDEPVSCMVNPRAGREHDLDSQDLPDGRARRFAVLGAGPAGMQAAKTLAELGHAVEVFEAAPEIGGQFRLAQRVPGKEVFAETLRYFESELTRLGVPVHLGRPVAEGDEDLLATFDGVIVATGVRPRPVAIPGADLPHVHDYAWALSDDVSGNRFVIIGGGGVAVDVAHRLSHRSSRTGCERERFRWEHGIGGREVELLDDGQDVTVLQRGRRLGRTIGKTTRWVVLGDLKRNGVRVRSEITYDQITEKGVWIANSEGAYELIQADRVIVAAGQESNTDVLDVVRRSQVEYQVVGGARQADGIDAVRAFEEGMLASRELVRSVDQRLVNELV